MLFVVAGGVAGRRGVVAFAGGRGAFAGKSVRLRAPGVSPGAEGCSPGAGVFWSEGRGGCCCRGFCWQARKVAGAGVFSGRAGVF